MPEPLKLAVAGLGRMGWIHARNAAELERTTGACQVAALVDADVDRARRFASQYQCGAPVFGSLEELASANVCNATFVVTPTDHHRAHTTLLVKAGHRVLLEKPLTGTLDGDTAFAAELDRDYPQAVMLAFQRRFDPGLRYAKSLMDDGAVGRVFKIYSALEDSSPAPNGYNSPGILPDMSVHNVDEILWLTGKMPTSALAIGTRIHSHKLTTCTEDFDDALLYMWFEGELVAQVQVARNHVSGYRVETIVFGAEGQIHVGRFEQQPLETVVEAYGRRGNTEPIARRTFVESPPPEPGPEFVDRFGSAYQAELAAFVGCCRTGAKFPTSHLDGLRAQRVIAAGMQRPLGESDGTLI
jgi:myo-inositol 2-dehydrogenase / D-chiro-inositol 1-dehydrogenase